VMCGMTKCWVSKPFLNTVSTVTTLSHSSLAPSQASLLAKRRNSMTAYQLLKPYNVKQKNGRNELRWWDHGNISRQGSYSSVRSFKQRKVLGSRIILKKVKICPATCHVGAKGVRRYSTHLFLNNTKCSTN
jgi:hypothetical protein